jgi:hypothetical protein
MQMGLISKQDQGKGRATRAGQLQQSKGSERKAREIREQPWLYERKAREIL